MEPRIKALIDYTETKIGLDNYYLESHKLHRYVTILNETVYTLSMEWFPEGAILPEEDDLNPDGTAVIEINIHTKKFESIIFVDGKSYANGIVFSDDSKDNIIKWIEEETGVTYDEQFHLKKEEERELLFQRCIDGIVYSPGGFIEVKCDEKGNLTYFSIHGPFPSKEIVNEEAYTLSLEKIEKVAKAQVKLIEFPSFEQEKLYHIYGVDEIYITNEAVSTIPFEMMVDVGSYLKVDQTIGWNAPAHSKLEREEIQLTEDI